MSHIPTHYIVWCSWDSLQVNSLQKVVWATLNEEANMNWIHIEIVWDFNLWKPYEAQYTTVKNIVKELTDKYPWIELKKHWDFQAKNCPWVNFDMNMIWILKPIPHANWAKRPLPAIKWNTIQERAKSFISTYWYSYSSFVNKSIKEEVLICIAFAEWFWKNSWSTGNIMNCWNNDRWDRVSFDGYAESVSCAINKLNGKWLWNKQTIGDLSFAGNGKIDMKYIYASSNWPREINVRNCLGKIYNRNIDPDFMFRK